MAMADLFDYLHWRGDLTFTQDPVNPVDTLIFSALSYISFTGAAAVHPDVPIRLKEAAEEYFALPESEQCHRVKSDLNLLKAAAETRRFGFSMLTEYRDSFIPAEETQFAAMTFLLDDGSAVLAFRGTDYSLVGWKEDFSVKVSTGPARSGKGHTKTPLQTIRFARLKHFQQHLSHR